MRLTLFIISTSVLNTACAVELIDSIIAERGVTECTSSGSGESDETASDSTGNLESSESSGTAGFDASTSGEPETSTTETGSSETGNTETGPAPAICGNGIVEGDETCDDGNNTPNDGCQECAKDSIVFVTSELYQGFSLEGLYGADQRCRSLAGKAALARHLTFKAWLSSSAESAATRLIHSKGRYVLVNGLMVAQNWSGLTSGILINPIMVDETSQSREDRVWTGTLSTGEPAVGTDFCDDWKDTGVLKFAGSGISMNIDETWSFFDNDGTCTSEARLYCIEQ